MLEPANDALPTEMERSSEPQVTVDIRGVSKWYGAHKALDSIDLTLYAGEFVALLGPNGAGKSTLIKLLDGVYQHDKGELRFGGADSRVSAGVIHQDLGLFNHLTVAENLFVAREGALGFLSVASERRAAVELLELVGLSSVDPRAVLRDLSLGERALVAVARLWSRGAGVIIVDEVTASLPRAEAFWLIDHLKTAASNGVTVVMVTHRLEELLGHVDRYVVLVDGRIAMDAPASAVEHDDLIAVLSQERSALTGRGELKDRSAGEAVVTLNNVSAGRLGPVSLELRKGLITGLSGSSVSGFHDVAYLAAGIIRPRRGTVTVKKGTTVTCLPAHRDVDGVLPDQTVEFNVANGNWKRWRKFGLIDSAKMRGEVAASTESLNVIPRNTDAVITTLSGGNQQKALMARVTINRPDCVVLCEPTRGVDITTRQEIYSFIRQLANEGRAILVVSSDIEDLSSLADRIGVVDDDGRLERWIESDGIEEFCTLRAAQG